MDRKVRENNYMDYVIIISPLFVKENMQLILASSIYPVNDVREQVKLYSYESAINVQLVSYYYQYIEQKSNVFRHGFTPPETN
jgi:hypothetical protein